MTIPRLQRIPVAHHPASAGGPDGAAFSDTQRAVQRRLSTTAERFLEFVEAHPRLLERRSFAPVHARMRRVVPNLLGTSGEAYGMQPWPVLFSAARWREIERVTAGLDRLVRSLPRRLFGDDPRALADAFDLGSPERAELILAEPSGFAESICRGDFADTADGLRCLEWNAGSVGSWQCPALSPPLLAAEEYAPFFASIGGEPTWVDTPRLLFRHTVRSCLARPGLVGDELNVLVLAGPPPYHPATHAREAYDRTFRDVLAELAPGVRGEVRVVAAEAVESWYGAPRIGPLRFRAVIEQNEMLNPPDLYRAFKAGELMLLTGPASFVLGDKRNLALLSEHADSPRFSAEERELVRAYVPWTRVLRPGTATGPPPEPREVDLLRHVRGGRAELVLKKGLSVGGMAVVIGSAVAETAWQAAVDAALAEGGWIVQQAVDPLPYAFQAGEAGWAPHRAIWGIFAFGGEAAGLFVRLSRRDRSPIVNVSQGAEYGLAFVAGE